MILDAELNFSVSTIVGSVAMGGFAVLWFLVKSAIANNKEELKELHEKLDKCEDAVEKNRREIDTRVTELRFDLLKEFSELRAKINDFRK